jgi:hypothetical protein
VNGKKAMMKPALIATVIMLFSGSAYGERVQRVWVEAEPANGGLVGVNVMYEAEESRLAGLGLRLHYNSGELEFVGIEEVLEAGFIGAMEPQQDLRNLDADPRTDTYLLLAWADLEAAWPGVRGTRLYRAVFRPLSAHPALVRFSSSSTAAGHQLAAEPVELRSNAPARSRRSLPARDRW